MKKNEETKRDFYVELIANMLKRCDIRKVKIAYEFILSLSR